SSRTSQPSAGITLSHHAGFYPRNLLNILEKFQQERAALPRNKISIKTQWSAGFQKKLREFLRRGHLSLLPSLVKQFPGAIEHPVIRCEIKHLAQMVRMKDIKDVRELRKLFDWEPDEGETILSISDKAEAKKLLESLLDQWVSRLLPGYMVVKKPTPPRPGRRAKHTQGFIFDCFFDFQDHCELLARIFPQYAQLTSGRTATFWKRQRGESQRKFESRMRKLLLRLHNESPHSRSIDYPSITRSRQARENSPTQAGGRTLNNEEWAELFQQRATVDFIPLPPPAIRSMLTYASRSRYNTVDPRRLLYAFLAHWCNLPPDAMRGVIERYESANPREAIQLNILLYPDSAPMLGR
ncbi:MAG: hypothetical protein KC643_29255, partial [Nitrospira sp.]|nr:hypothetical protein [Nitrospira sp.]